MDDLDLVSSALLAYASAVLTEEGAVSKSVNSVEDALSGDVLLAMAGIDSSKRYSNLQVLKIVYHRLITVHEYAYRLPCPDLDTLVSSQPPVLNFIKLYSVILLCQAVWSAENSRYVRIIQGLDQKYQECLKQVIEEALTSIPEPSLEKSFEEDKGEDETLQQADLVYRIQKHASRLDTKDETRLGISKGEENDLIEAEISQQIQTPSKRNRPSRTSIHRSDSHPRDPLKQKEHPTDVFQSRNDEAGTPSSLKSQRVTATERIQELQIERLQAELNDKAEELRDLEAQLDESRRNEQAYAHKIAELEEAVEELDRLRDEVEINRHVTEKLKKSETVADKLKKKLEAVPDMRSEIQALESQVLTLQEENAVWESKYTELFRSHDLTSEPPTEPPVDDVDSEKAAQLAELSVLVQQLEVALQAKDDEITQLRERAFERDHGAADLSSSSISDEDTLSAQPLVPETQSPPDAARATEESTTESLQTQASLLRRIAELEALLATATAPSSANGTFPPIRLSTDGRPEWESAQTNGNIANLERDIIKLRVQDALAETDLRRRAEKLSMLKAWTDLSQQAMTGAGETGLGQPDANHVGEGDIPVDTGTAERPPILSWASRIRRHMHSMSQ